MSATESVILIVLTVVSSFVGAFIGGGGIGIMRTLRRYRREAREKTNAEN